MTDQQLDLDEIETRAAHLYEYARQHGDGEGDTLAGEDVPALVAKVRRQRAELERRTEDVAFLERTTLPELRREIEHHKDGKQRWRTRAEKAEPRVAELAAVHAFLDEQELAARAFELPTPAWVEAVRAASVPPGAPLAASPASSVSESAQSPTGAATGRLGDPGALEPEVPLPDRLEAALTERFTELGNPFSRMSISFQGPDGWPASKEVGPRDVAEVLRELLAVTTEDLASADNPTHLRWGLNDVLWSDDDTVIVMLSGPDREAYWLELDPERAAVLREDLAGPDGESTTTPRRTLTPNEYSAAWHAVEGSAGDEGADPGTVLHAVLDRLGIEWQDAAQPAATTPAR
jgi:hypothetical protein